MSNYLKLIEAYGSGEIQLLSSSDRAIKPHETISSGSLAIDIASGIGGWPRNRVIEVFGNESSGKTTLATMACAQFNREGKRATYIDVEHSFDPRYAVALGVNPKLFALAQPSCAEDALKMLLDFAATDECGIVVLDSVAGLATRQELEGDLDDSNIGATARLMGRCLRKLPAVCRVHNTLAVFINQNRDKVGVVWGSPKTQPGGRALKFFSSIRVEFAKVQTNKDKNQNNEAVSNQTKASFIKNKVGPPHRECEFDIVFGEGIDNAKTVIKEGVAVGVLKKKGNTYSYQGNILGTSIGNAIGTIKADKELYEELRGKILAHHFKPTEREEATTGDEPIIKKKKKLKVLKPSGGRTYLLGVPRVLED
jgi:recombination protein RecA